MNHKENKRSLFKIVIALFTIGALAAGCTSSGNTTANNSSSQNQSTTAAGHSDAELALRQNMRKLWTDHTVWTRDYIIAAVDNKPDAKAAADRLMKNQEDIGNAIGAYYGKDAGDQLTSLLKQHISIAVDLIAVAKSGGTTSKAFLDQNTKWSKNGQDIADFLSNANPNWTNADMSEMMKTHLATTAAEVEARLHKDYGADVTAYDAVYDHILKMSDALSDGIIKQFPDKFQVR